MIVTWSIHQNCLLKRCLQAYQHHPAHQSRPQSGKGIVDFYGVMDHWYTQPSLNPCSHMMRWIKTTSSIMTEWFQSFSVHIIVIF